MGDSKNILFLLRPHPSLLNDWVCLSNCHTGSLKMFSCLASHTAVILLVNR